MERVMSGLPDLSGKIAVVTGGASGIGKGIAARLAAEGARVIIADIQRDALDATAAELGLTGVEVDVSDSASVENRPGTVHTNIGTSSRNRPADLGDAGFKDVDIELEDNPRYRWIYPEQAGQVVVRAIKRGDLYALTHPDWYPQVAARHDVIAEAFREQASAAGLS
jgi:hypothetical protein